ncbi:MAG: nuclear transport factor 2 family protein [Flavobacterium sp.]|nr:nuclear transport factor 2 family protein [Flavobacterium sp.]
MSAKKIVLDFYKSDALINPEVMETFLHPAIQVEWRSSRGTINMDRQDILELASELGKAYVRSKVRISQLVKEGDTVAVYYSHYIKTVENPREEMLLAHFMAFWEVKDNQLYKGYQISQLP